MLGVHKNGSRPFIHVAGPSGAGKTALVEALLGAFTGPVICVRGQRDDRLREPKESAPARDAELGQYRKAGASGVARYRFGGAEEDRDSFFSTDFMNDYSQAVVIEGDCPLAYTDLVVFVAPPLAAGTSLLECVERPERAKAVEGFQALLRPGALQKALADGRQEEILEMARVYAQGLQRGLGAMHGRGRRRPSLTKEWCVTARLRGIERAGLVVINARSPREKAAGQRMLPDLARLRTDDELRVAVLGSLAHRVPVTSVVADLTDRKDAAMRKALTRIKRTISQRLGPR
jgi:hypothetical protein